MPQKEVKKAIETELKLQGRSPQTLKMYVFYNLDFLDYTKKQPLEIDQDDVKAYLGHLFSDKSYNNASVSLARSALKYYYHDILNRPILSSIKVPKINRKIPDVPTKEEIKKLIDYCKKLRDKVLIEFIYSSGLRVAECASIKRTDLDFDEKIGILKSGKGKKDRILKLSDRLIEDLKIYLKNSTIEYIFPGEKSHISIRSIQRIVQNTAKKAGINKKIYCHLLRHAYATHLLEAGVDIRIIQELLGHSNLQTTQFYTQISKKQIKKVESPLDQL